MADTLAQLVVKLEAQTAEYDEKLERANKQLGKFQRKQTSTLDKISDTFSTAATAAGVAATGIAAAFGVMYARQSEVLVQLGQMSDRLAITTEDLQAFQYAGELVGVASETVTDGLRDMVERIGDAAVGGGEAREVFDQLGISINQLYALDTAQQFELLGNAIANMDSAADATAATFKVFGEAGGEILDLFGSDVIEQAAADIDALGLSISRVDAARVEAANQQFTRLQFLLSGLQQSLTITAAPYLEVLTNRLVGAAQDAGGLHVVLGEMFADAVDWAGEIIDKFNVWRRGVLFTTSAIWDAVRAWHELRGRTDEATAAYEKHKIARDKALDLIANPESGKQFAEEVRKAIDEAEARVEGIVQRQADMRDKLASGGGKQSTDEADAQQAALDSILAHLQTEEDALANSYYNRKEIVLENTLLTEMERQALLAELAGEYEEAQAELAAQKADELAAQQDEVRAVNLAKEQAYWDQFNKLTNDAFKKQLKLFQSYVKKEDKGWADHANFALNAIGSITEGFGKESGALFEIGKAHAIAMAIINTAQGVTAALKMGYVGIPLAAVIAAAGAAQIATIVSTSPSSGGGSIASPSGGGAVAPGTPIAEEIPDVEPERSVQNVNIVVEPGIYDSNSVRDLITAINDELSDGIDLNVRVG